MRRDDDVDDSTRELAKRSKKKRRGEREREMYITHLYMRMEVCARAGGSC